MAKNKNKGFTLIEIIIAIAILTVLLVPIMRQFTQTLDTSRRAKELQYINENAAYVLEMSQRTDLSNIASGSDAADVADDIKINTVTKHAAITCRVYNPDGTAVSGPDGEVQYTATHYVLNDVKLGAKRHVYGREVVTDDLSAKLAAKSDILGQGYKVAYGLTDADLANFSGDFELTNEGSIVQYDSNGFVTAVACNKVDTVNNPNDTNLGNMQDLDVTKVAIIPGTAQSFDAQAESQFFSITMDKLKEADYESWLQAMMHESNDSILNTVDYAGSLQKVTKIYIDENDNGTPSNKSDDYYVVKADVYYHSSYSIASLIENGGSASVDETLSYNVFSQKFYTDRCPDIYFEYQPYSTEYRYGTNPYVEYATDDDIIIDNYVENPDGPVKLYLYKPTADQSNTAYHDGVDDAHAYYTRHGGTTKVRINVYKMNSNVKPVDIYTNLYGTTDAGAKVIDHTQFKVGLRPTISSIVTDSPKTENQLNTVREDYDYSNIKLLEEDTRYADRLLTVTVKLTPKDTDNKMVNQIKLTGAKGEN
ncbi:MAG: prepilin-type N-terminal cleavage/methylation domain-containing protein [Clostridium sp.]|nr:prepilin-type N-terminal cleavage/methylation domain-containing protein [Clostridium sp.]